MNNKIEIKTLRYPTLKKCEICDRVKDIYFRTTIKDYDTPEFEVGNLNCCKDCGSNLSKILGNKENLGESIVKEFTFNK